MAEKKRVAVVMESSATTTTTANFDFTSFQTSLEGTATSTSGSTGSRAGFGGGDGADDSGTYTTAYQARKTSIADGLTAEQLVVEHRKSIAGVAGVDATQLGGLTLSRRQSMTQEEYGGDVNQKAYESLAPFVFAPESTGTGSAQ